MGAIDSLKYQVESIRDPLGRKASVQHGHQYKARTYKDHKFVPRNVKKTLHKMRAREV